MALQLAQALPRSLKSISSHVAHIRHIRKPHIRKSIYSFLVSSRSFRSSAVLAQAAIFSNAFSSSPGDMTLVPPQKPIDWNHSPEDITRLTQKTIDADRTLLDKIGALDSKDCNFDSVSSTLLIF